MSQITRCPSCTTTFKVVADQLRISEGWVRCGQCKEVFDASAHLLAAAPPALLPDVSLTDVRSPPSPVARDVGSARSWGESPAPPAVTSPVQARSSAADGGTASPVSVTLAVAAADAAGEPGVPHAPVVEAASPFILNVPHPAVPAFLAAAPGAMPPGELLQRDGGPFSWYPRSAAAPEAGKQLSVAAEGASSTAAGTADAAKGGATPAGAMPDPTPAPLTFNPAGYELPSAQLPDAPEGGREVRASLELQPMGYPPLELPVKPSGFHAQLHPPTLESKLTPAAAAVQDILPSLPPVDFVPLPVVPEPVAPGPQALALEEDRSPAAILQAPLRKPASLPSPPETDEDDEAPGAGEEEVSFVLAARRKAFWRKPLVRGVLGMLILVFLVGLALQIAVQERDRLAATDSRARPWLLALCVPFKCEIAPQRQIADVVIDSSSFNKARGDSYQLALTMKSKASIPVAMPAVELTLTDAQDQPVLRRVLLPTDMGAPMELQPRGEWSASVAVIVTTGGARVAGYRLLAFYP